MLQSPEESPLVKNFRFGVENKKYTEAGDRSGGALQEMNRVWLRGRVPSPLGGLENRGQCPLSAPLVGEKQMQRKNEV